MSKEVNPEESAIPGRPGSKDQKPESLSSEFSFVVVFAAIVALILLARALGIF